MSYLEFLAPARRKVFISYQHHGDRPYYLEFARFFSETYEAVEDHSVEREIDSDDAEYVSRCIRENYITGTSCTIVLCGPTTHHRKFVDWEIKATLDKQHGLVGVNLPTNPPGSNGLVTVPGRLHDNVESGYAVWTNWNALTLDHLKQVVELANGKSKTLIRNARSLKSRNG